MRIAVDAMGGDHAPLEIIKGAIEAIKDDQSLEVILVGDEAIIKAELAKYQYNSSQVSIVHAAEVIAMGEHPATAVRKKKESSIVVGTKLVKEGNAAAIVSAGSTGAQMAAALFILGRIKGIDRPAIVTLIPTQSGKPLLLLDAGANADVKPEQLVQFALMGNIYASKVLKRANPQVGLLNIGAEEAKGSELYVAAHQLLKTANFNFIGNVEGRDVPKGEVDIIVCDGFVGNVVLKLMEGLAKSFAVMIKEALMEGFVTKLGAMLAAPGLRKFKQRLDYAEYGGAPLLGVNGISIISHGSSNAKAVKNAIRVAKETVAAGLNNAIAAELRDGE